MRTRSALTLVVCACLAGCAASSETAGSQQTAVALATHIDVPPPPAVAPLPASRVTYYQQAFPDAARFEARGIPKEMISTADAGNESYAVAYAADGSVHGYLRDFTGPVSTAEDCPCSPLTLTLVLDPDFSLRTILTPAPLEKRDKEQMTAADVEQLIALSQTPPKELLSLRNAEALVDATTGATKTALEVHVVPTAAYSTWRVVTLVRATQKVLKGAPLAWDSRRLRSILDTPATALATARALAEFMPTAESADTELAVFRRMAKAYAEALTAGAEPDEAVESRLLAPGLPAQIQTEEVVHACYGLAQSGKRLKLVERCWRQASADKTSPAEPTALQRLQGTLIFERGDPAAAAPILELGASDVEVRHDPQLHLRLTLALTAAGKKKPACKSAKGLYLEHPRLDGAKEALRACAASPSKVLKSLHAKQRKALLARRRADGEPAPSLSLEGPQFKPIELDMATPGKATVLVFFATWCPHCLNELPQINAFHAAVEDDYALRGKVRIFGVRTAVERETVLYDTFLATYAPRFDIGYDATMSLAFGKFARAHGIRTSLPTVAVLDEEGIVRYFLDSGPYRDVQRELTWAVQDALKR